MRAANLALRFLLELAMLAALATWGFTVGAGWPLKLLLGAGGPVLAAAVWGVWLAPRSPRRLPAAGMILLEVVLFGLAAAGLATTGHRLLAVVLAGLYALNRVLIGVWRQDTGGG